MYSEKKDTREGLSGECLTKSALSFDDSTKRKSLPFDVNLSSFSDHTIQDFDDFDFVGLDYGAWMLPSLKYETDSSELKPLVDFDATSNRTYKSGVLVPNSEKKNTRGASKRQCMTKSVPCFDAPDNRAHLVGAHQSTSSMELERPENEGIISDLLGFLRDKEFYKRIGKAWKRGYLLYDSPCTDRSSLIAAMANCLEFDIYDLNLMGVSSISELTNVLVPIRNRSVIAIKDFDRWYAMLPSLKNEKQG